MENKFDINTRLGKAVAFAIDKHTQFNQTREDLVTPYYVHILRVVERLQKIDLSEEVLMAAALHDVVEDCEVSLDEIRSRFGDEVAQYVEELTVDKLGSQENENYLQKLSLASTGGKTIKLADKWDNIWELRTKKYPTYGGISPKEYLVKAKTVLEVCKDGNTELVRLLENEIKLLDKSL